VVDYCHYFHAYIDDYPYPKSYHPLAIMVRQWARKESDEDWKTYVDQVFFF